MSEVGPRAWPIYELNAAWPVRPGPKGQEDKR